MIKTLITNNLIKFTQNPKADTAWLGFPLIIKKGAPFNRRDLVIYLEENGIQTRPVFTGNVLRQPAFKKLKAKKLRGGYPEADNVMENSLVVGLHHGMDSAQLNYMTGKFSEFIKLNSK